MQVDRKILFLMSLMFISFIFGAGCGSMNPPPKNTSGQTIQNSPDGATALVTTKNNQFYAYLAPVEMQNHTQKLSKLELGENKFALRFVHVKEFCFPSGDAKVQFVYWMPDMPEMGKFEETGSKQADGSYTAVLFFSMAGRWEVIAKIQDQQVQDESVFETKL